MTAWSVAYDKFIEYAWVALVGTLGWALRLNNRVTKLEADHVHTVTALVEIKTNIKDVDDKLQRLIEKFL